MSAASAQTVTPLAVMSSFIERAPWVFAKTMPQIPHEYTVHGQTPYAEFERAVLLIREHGYRRDFEGPTCTYLDVDGWHYWTMGAPVNETTILNRARNENS